MAVRLGRLTGLTNLDLNDNLLGDQAASASRPSPGEGGLLGRLPPGLRKLTIWRNRLGRAGGVALLRSLEACTGLVRLGLDGGSEWPKRLK